MTSPAFFISDVHLMMSRSQKEKSRRSRLLGFLDHVQDTEGTLFILGDFFDFWFEYKHVIPAYYLDILARLKALTEAGIQVHFVAGNHDYWTRGYLREEIGMHVYLDDTEIEIDGHKFFLSHGDGLQTWDRGYRMLRTFLRSKVVMFLFRWLHPDVGIWLAGSSSRYSRENNKDHKKEQMILGHMLEFSKTKWDEGFDTVVSGHYHLNTLEQQEAGNFLCMGDWIDHCTYGLFTGGELTLQAWPEQTASRNHLSPKPKEKHAPAL